MRRVVFVVSILKKRTGTLSRAVSSHHAVGILRHLDKTLRVIYGTLRAAGLTHRSVRRLRLSVRWRGKYGKRGRIVYCGLDKDEQRVNLLMHLLLIMVSGCRCIS